MIFLVGNCVLDEVWQVDHFPQEDEEMRALERHRRLGGNACNSARILSQLGHSTQLVGTFAEDIDADWMLDTLQQSKIGCQHIQRIADSQTPCSVIFLNRQNGSRSIVHHRQLAELSPHQLAEIDCGSARWLHLEGRNIEGLKALLTLNRPDCPISLEIEKPRPGIEALLPQVDLAIVSKAYLMASGQSAIQCLGRFQRINPALDLVCTLGEDGLQARSAKGENITMPGIEVACVVDSIGAGDCFIAGLIHQSLKTENFIDALRFANRLAARKIQHLGMNIDD